MPSATRVIVGRPRFGRIVCGLRVVLDDDNVIFALGVERGSSDITILRQVSTLESVGFMFLAAGQLTSTSIPISARSDWQLRPAVCK